MIRYLAYDKKSKKTRIVKSLVFNGDGYKYEKNEFVLANMWGKDCTENKNIIVQREAKDVILMQLIGRKDINGKELHEGAIVEFETVRDMLFEENSKPKKGFVEYEEIECIYLVVTKNSKIPLWAINGIEKIGIMPMDSELLEF